MSYCQFGETCGHGFRGFCFLFEGGVHVQVGPLLGAACLRGAAVHVGFLEFVVDYLSDDVEWAGFTFENEDFGVD